MEKFDVIVAGVGAVGSATLYHLAKSGLRVAGLDPYAPGHSMGSSHGDTRIIRKAYFLHPEYLPLLNRSYDLWRELEAESGQDLMRITGLLCIGDEDSAFIQGIKRTFEANALPYEQLTAAETRSQFPVFAVPDDMTVLHDHEGGYLRPEACVMAHAAQAEKLGAAVFAGESLRAWRAEGDGVCVTTSRRELHADRLVLTTGAWVTPEFATLGVPLRVRRKVLFWHQCTQPDDFRDIPVWIWKNRGSDFYGFPSLDGATIKSAEDTGGSYLEKPEDRDFHVFPEDDANLTPFLHEAFPGKVGEVQHGKTCLYTDTSDRNFVIGFHPGHPQVLLASCCSGHGFKLSSAMGEVLAKTVQMGKLPKEAEFLAMKRA